MSNELRNKLTKVEKEAVDNATRQYLQLKIMEACIESPDLEELSFFRQTVEVDGGGTYLLSFQHVNGPKIKLK